MLTKKEHLLENKMRKPSTCTIADDGNMNLTMTRGLLRPIFLATFIALVGSTKHQKGRTLTAESSKKEHGVGRIVGGNIADHTRYPYMAYLSSCGGTLIAPDIILTAAHCFTSEDRGSAVIGAYNISDLTKEGVEVHIFQEVVSHPRYYQPVETFFPDEFDYSLIKIFDTSKVGSVIKVNGDPSVPDSTPDVPLRVLGWGRTVASDSDSRSDLLVEADVHFVPNDVCSQVSAIDNGVPYSLENMIFNISLCAADFEKGADSCGGDSGGPILLAGQKAGEDVQLGITSYGAIECGHPEIPAVYARVSYAYDWIRDNVCRMSLSPPENFECDAPTARTEPVLSTDMVNMTLEFVADVYADEAGWIVQSPNEDEVLVTYAYKPIGTYAKGVNESETFNFSTTFSLPNNRYYILTMFDSYGDGFYFGEGDFAIKLSTSESTILDESREFDDYAISFDFLLGTLPTASPTTTPAPTYTMAPSMAPTVVPPIVWVVIEFDDRPYETGWRIEAMYEKGELETLKEVYPGTYNEMETVFEPVRLLSQTPMSYRFTLTDNEANGICCDHGKGSYEVWLGEPGTGEILTKGSDLIWEISHDFTISMMSNGTYTIEPPLFATSSASRCRFAFTAAILLFGFVARVLL